jgi:uncharacterized spore protein YtfJ
MTTRGLIDSALEHVRTNASMKTVFGEPVRVDGRTLIPVAKVPGTQAVGATARPIGVVEVSATETKFRGFGQTKRFAWVAAISAAVGLLVGRLVRRRGARETGF